MRAKVDFLPRWPVLGFLVGMVALQGACSPSAESPNSGGDGKPNIIFILADDWDFDELGQYDNRQFPSHTAAHLAGRYPTGKEEEGGDQYYEDPRMLTPHINSLARDGAMFSRFYVTSAICAPSRYSFMSGRYASRSLYFAKIYKPSQVASIDNPVVLDPDEPNTAKALKELGYATGFVGKWHIGSLWVDHKDKQSYEEGLEFLRNDMGFDFAECVHFRNIGPDNMEWLTESALTFISRSYEKPFFLCFSVPVPHDQFQPLTLDATRTVTGQLPNVPRAQPERRDVLARLSSRGVDQRNAEATWVDDSVGAILSKLEELGIAEKTVVVFTSDHQSRGKSSAYEGARVPFLARWPGKIKAGTRIDDLCANIDLLPTFLEMAGGTPPVDTDGESFLKHLLGRKPAVWRQNLLLEIVHTRAIVTEEWKYIANRPPQKVAEAMKEDARRSKRLGRRRSINWRGTAGSDFFNMLAFPGYFEEDQLYNLEDDFLEQKNLANDPMYADTLSDMKSRLRMELSSMPHSFGEFTQKSRLAAN